MSNEPTPEAKQYGLTKGESSLLRYTQNHLQAILSGILSTIAVERLGYQVTEYTQFEVSQDMTTIKLMELQPVVQSPASDTTESPVAAAPDRNEPDPGDTATEAPVVEAPVAPNEPTPEQ